MKTLFRISLVIVALVALFVAPIAAPAALAILPFNGRVNINDLEAQAARDLSSFDGFEGRGFGYTGEGDDLLDFGGQYNSFLDLPIEDKIFVMTIVNAHATDTLTVYLTGGILKAVGGTLVGTVADGAFNAVGGTAGCTGSGSPTTIAMFHAFLAHKPIQVSRIKIESTVATQMAQQLTIQQQSPFKTLESRILNPNSYQTQDTYRDKVVVFDTPNLILTNDQTISYPLVVGTTSITFYCGAIMNPSRTLERRIGEARSTIGRAIAAGAALPQPVSVQTAPADMKKLRSV